jgi:Zn-dependent metalloprotease
MNIHVLGLVGWTAVVSALAAFSSVVAAAEEVHNKPITGLERQRLIENKATTSSTAMSSAEARLAMPANHRLEAGRIFVDASGTTHTRTRLFYENVPVSGISTILHTGIDGTERQSGRPPVVPALNTLPTFDSAAIKSVVAADIGDSQIDDRRIETELRIKLIRERRLREGHVLASAPTATDYEYRVIGSRLVYFVKLHASRIGGTRDTVFEIDANNGEILFKHDGQSRLEEAIPQNDTTTDTTPSNRAVLSDSGMATGADGEAPILAVGHTQYSGEVSVPTRRYDDLITVLGRSEIAWGPTGTYDRAQIDVRSMDGVGEEEYEDWGDLNPFPDVGKYLVWGDGRNYTTDDLSRSDSIFSRHGQTAAADVLYGASVTWDLWQKVFDYRGLDGDGNVGFSLVVHAPNESDREPTSPYFADLIFLEETKKYVAVFPDPEPGEKQLTTPETVAHELGHGMFLHSIDDEWSVAIFFGEFGGISEANSDIIGVVAEFYETTYPDAVGNTVPATGGNWTLGENESADGMPYRYFYKPSKDGASFDAWFPEINDCDSNGFCLDPHRTSGPLNRMFYFLSEGVKPSWGDPDYTSIYLPDGMTGLGIDKAARIWFKATRDYLLIDSTFAQMRYACELAAEDLYGAHGRETRAVQDAFSAVNVGPPADRTPPLISITASGPLGNRLVSVSLDDTHVAGGVIHAEVRKIKNGEKTIYTSSFSGSAGILNIGNVGFRTVRVSVTAHDMDGNEAKKIEWYDHEAPTIVPGEFGDNNGHHGDGVSCEPPGDHHPNTRTCKVTLLDLLSLSHVEIYFKGEQDTLLETIYRYGWTGADHDHAPPAPPFRSHEDTCFPPFCGPEGWPSSVRHEFEFEIDLSGLAAEPGSRFGFRVLAHDMSDNKTHYNGNFRLTVDTWAPEILNVRISGSSGVVEFEADISDATGEVDVRFYVDGTLLCERSGTGWSTFPLNLVCPFDSASVANGLHEFLVRATDQWGNASIRKRNFVVDNENPDDDPPPCPTTFHEIENNHEPPNVVRPCTRRIVGNFDPAGGFNLDSDRFSIPLKPGEELAVTSPAFCSSATINVCFGPTCGPAFAQPMGILRERTARNYLAHDASASINIYFYDHCQFRDYELQMSVQ